METEPSLMGSTTTSAPAAGAAGSGAPSTPVTGAGGSSASWRDVLPEGIRNDPSLSSFQDIPAFAQAFIHTKALVGKKGAIPPGDKAPPEQWKQFYKDLGVPDSVDKYTIESPKGANEERVKRFKESALEAGLFPHQAKKILDDYVGLEASGITKAQEASKAMAKKTLDELKTELGEGFDQGLKRAQFAAKEVGGDRWMKFIENARLADGTRLGDHPEVIHRELAGSKLLKEDRFLEGTPATEASTRAEIQNELNSHRMQLTTMKPNDPNRPIVKAKFEALAKRLTGGK